MHQLYYRVVMPWPGSARLWPSSGARADFLAPELPWAALSQLSQRKISKVGWAHFCWHYLVSHPPIYIYKLITRYMYNKYGKKHSAPSVGNLCCIIWLYLPMENSTKQCCSKSSPGFWWLGMLI